MGSGTKCNLTKRKQNLNTWIFGPILFELVFSFIWKRSRKNWLEVWANMNTWRIIPVSKWLVPPIYRPFRPFGRGTTLLRGLTNHGYQPLTNWDDPPSITLSPIIVMETFPIFAELPLPWWWEYIQLYWLIGILIMVLYSIYNWVVFHPLYTLNNPGGGSLQPWGKLWPRTAPRSKRSEKTRHSSQLWKFFRGPRSVGGEFFLGFCLVSDFFYGLYHDKSSSNYQFGETFWFFKLIFYGSLLCMYIPNMQKNMRKNDVFFFYDGYCGGMNFVMKRVNPKKLGSVCSVDFLVDWDPMGFINHFAPPFGDTRNLKIHGWNVRFSPPLEKEIFIWTKCPFLGVPC